MSFVYRFPTVRGIQAGRAYYIAMVPLKMIPRLFPDDEEYVLPEYRAQRKLNVARIPVISRYILENRGDYVFSALAASIDGDFTFIEADGYDDLGILEVSMDARFLINDGQHRKAAIISALSEDSTIGEETISIVFYADQGLERSQQIFTDLNKNAVKTSNSISELYDARDDVAVVTKDTIANISFLDEYTDKEKDNLGKFSSNLFTLNTFYAANKSILHGHKVDQDSREFIGNYWMLVTRHMILWNELQCGSIRKTELREDYIATQAVVIQALGRIGRYFYTHRELQMDDYLARLEGIDWRRNAPCWQMRAINDKGKVMTNKTAIALIVNIIKLQIKLPLTSEEQKIEDKAVIGQASHR